MSSTRDSLLCPLCRHAKHDGRACHFNTMDKGGGIGWCQCAIMTPRCTRHVGCEVVLSENGRCGYCSHIEQYERIMSVLRGERDEAREEIKALDDHLRGRHHCDFASRNLVPEEQI